MMRDFVILGSSIVTPPPNPPSSSSSSTPSTTPSPSHRHRRHHHKPKLTPSHSHSSSISCTLQAPLNHYIHVHVHENAPEFVPSLNVKLLAKEVLAGIRGRKVRAVIDSLKRVQELGGVSSLSSHFDGHAMDLFSKECRRLVKSGQLEEAVQFMEDQSYPKDVTEAA